VLEYSCRVFALLLSAMLYLHYYFQRCFLRIVDQTPYKRFKWFFFFLHGSYSLLILIVFP
jgi:hypothetical protein